MSPHLGFVSDAEKELARRTLILMEVMPFAHTCLFDYRGGGVADDGTPVDHFRNTWTLGDLTLSADGRVFKRTLERIVAGGSVEIELARVLPSQRDWLRLGGFTHGGTFDDDEPHEDLAF